MKDTLATHLPVTFDRKSRDPGPGRDLRLLPSECHRFPFPIKIEVTVPKTGFYNRFLGPYVSPRTRTSTGPPTNLPGTSPGPGHVNTPDLPP